VPSRRELIIQIDKLENLANKFDKKFTWRLVLSTPEDTYRQKKASDMHRLTLQSKHVDDLFSRVIEEILLQLYPDEIPVKRKGFAERARKFTAGYNKKIKEEVALMREEAKARARALSELSPSELSSGKS
jgi:hypothetical protein